MAGHNKDLVHAHITVQHGVAVPIPLTHPGSQPPSSRVSEFSPWVFCTWLAGRLGHIAYQGPKAGDELTDL